MSDIFNCPQVPICMYGVHSLGHLLMFSRENKDAAPPIVVSSMKKVCIFEIAMNHSGVHFYNGGGGGEHHSRLISSFYKENSSPSLKQTFLRILTGKKQGQIKLQR